MNISLKYLLAAVAVLALSGCGYTRIPAGYVGVEVDLYGTEKGTQLTELGTGGHWYNPMTTEIHEFPTFTQTYAWDTETNTAFMFDTVEGMKVGADISVIYKVDGTKVSELFTQYRRGLDEITGQYIYAAIRNSLTARASQLPIETVYGKGKAALLEEVEDDVRKQVEPFGLIIEQISWNGSLALPPEVTKSINAKIEATQIAQQRRNQVETAKAAADIAIEEARGKADSLELQAIAEAEAIRIRGEALRENPELIQLTIAEKWQGEFPQTYIGGGSDSANLLFQLPAPKQ